MSNQKARDRLEAIVHMTQSQFADRITRTEVAELIADLDAATAARDAILNDFRAACDEIDHWPVQTPKAVASYFRALIERHEGNQP